MAPLASVEELEARVGRAPGESELARWGAVLEDVSALVRGMTGGAWDPAADPPVPTPADLKAVVIARAVRTLNNPDGIRQETIGRYSYTLAAGADVLSGAFTRDEMRVLNRYRQFGEVRIGLGEPGGEEAEE